jgi:ligand-binding sensor domain-containing protein
MLNSFLFGQDISFHHFNTTKGLTSNIVSGMVVDKNGFLWVATVNGLTRYDANSVKTFRIENTPGMVTNFIGGDSYKGEAYESIFCDSKNRIWTGSFEGDNYIDENGKFHRAVLQDTITNYSADIIFETKHDGVILMANKGHHFFNEQKNRFDLLEWTEHTDFRVVPILEAKLWKEDLFIYSFNDRITIMDFQKQKQVSRIMIPDNPHSACRINDDEILVGTRTGKLFRINVGQNKIVKVYNDINTYNGVTLNTSINKIRNASDGSIVITTGTKGIFIFHPNKETFRQYMHNPLDASSLCTNNTDKVFCDDKGNVFISSRSAGVDYFNIYNTAVTNHTSFTNSLQGVYDNYISCIYDTGNEVWLGGNDRLIQYNPTTKKTAFYYYPFLIDEQGGKRNLEVAAVLKEGENVWVGTPGGGVGILKKGSNTFTPAFFNPDANQNLPSANFIWDLMKADNNGIWIATSLGLKKINISTLKVDSSFKQTALKQLDGVRVQKLFSDSKKRMWIGTYNAGVYCYNPLNGSIINYSRANGLADNNNYCFAEDNDGTIYAGSVYGVSAIGNNNTVTILNKKNGLLNERCTGLLADEHGDIWIGNENCIIQYIPSNKQFRYFDDKAGINYIAYRNNASFSANKKTLWWGSSNGVSSFDVNQLHNQKNALDVSIYQADMRDVQQTFSKTATVELPWRSNSITFYYTAPDFTGSGNILFQYRLDGAEKKWSEQTTQRSIRYTALQPGNYTFFVRASNDGVNWTDAKYSIHITVVPPVWRRPWFIISSILFLAISFFAYIKHREKIYKKKVNEKAMIDKHIAEVEMQALRAQMNPHFMFNSLNSINNFILKNDPDNASGYLTKFSRLMRLILDNSRSEWVLLENELKALELYIELEAVRFDNTFNYNVEVTKDISGETVMVPPLLIQPYVENAIWHGLLHRKQPGGKLDIRLWKNNDTLHIEIEDNGVGRDEAKRLKSKTATKQKSHGMKITAERMDIVNKVYDVGAGVTITDLNNNGKQTGTRVLITLKYQTHDSHYSR